MNVQLILICKQMSLDFILQAISNPSSPPLPLLLVLVPCSFGFEPAIRGAVLDARHPTFPVTVNYAS